MTTCTVVDGEADFGDTCTAGQVGTEICDNVDNDCDGSVDENLTQETSCGIGACASTGVETCSAGNWGGDTCTAGQVGTEICDNVDNDCDGTADEGNVCAGPCDNFTATPTACGTGECAASGMTTCTVVGGEAIFGNTCAPGDPSDEVCDDADNDCDGAIDEGNVCGPGQDLQVDIDAEAKDEKVELDFEVPGMVEITALTCGPEGGSLSQPMDTEVEAEPEDNETEVEASLAISDDLCDDTTRYVCEGMLADGTSFSGISNEVMIRCEGDDDDHHDDWSVERREWWQRERD